jgi:signal transduction histidine kinase
MTVNPDSRLEASDVHSILNSLGDGILIFDLDGNLLLDNQTIRDILGQDLVSIRAGGWPDFAALVDNAQADQVPVSEDIRTKAIREVKPVRFSILLDNASTPCWASAIRGETDADTLLMITITQPDWTPLTELMKTFRSEASTAINDTKNHADLIRRLAETRSHDMTADQLGERVLGFSELMSAAMFRLQNLLEQLHRLEVIRTGQLRENVERTKRKIVLLDFVEDFLEEIVEKPITDMPLKGDLRDRIDVDIASTISVYASRPYLEFALRDILRNAVMYSEQDTLINIRAKPLADGNNILIQVEDHGYGIREKEQNRVFKPFQRARQPQIIAEFGYGLSLYLAKANIEAMNGTLDFESEEGAGTTFNLQLPVFRDDL